MVPEIKRRNTRLRMIMRVSQEQVYLHPVRCEALAAAQHYDLRSTLECGVSVDLESILGLPGAERGSERGQAQAAKRTVPHRRSVAPTKAKGGAGTSQKDIFVQAVFAGVHIYAVVIATGFFLSFRWERAAS